MQARASARGRWPPSRFAAQSALSGSENPDLSARHPRPPACGQRQKPKQDRTECKRAVTV
eukprot:2520830-Rhodomonas_salina.3